MSVKEAQIIMESTGGEGFNTRFLWLGPVFLDFFHVQVWFKSRSLS